MLRYVIAFLAAIALPLLLAQSGLFQRLGAHPWWALQVAYVGAPIGAVLAMLPLGQTRRFLFGFGVLAIAIASAAYGKTQFAASFGEDALAGRFWHFGWIGIAAGDALIVAALVLFVLPEKDDAV